MAVNQIVPFGLGAGSNVLASADWSALAARLSGFQSGVAKSVEVNTALRQAAFVAAMVAQFTSDVSGNDVLDNGDSAGFQASFSAAVEALPHLGITAISGLSNANVTLTATQAAKPIISLIGALTGNVQIIFPGQAQQWLVVNNTSGAFTVTCKTASGSGVVIPQGATMAIYGDGTNIAQGGFSLASTAQAQALSSPITLLTPATLADAFKGANSTLAVPGFIKYPNGLIEQWFKANHTAGANGNQTLTFPFAFPNAAFDVHLQDNAQISAGAVVWAVSGLNTAGVTAFWNYSSVTGGTTNRAVFARVLGY